MNIQLLSQCGPVRKSNEDIILEPQQLILFDEEYIIIAIFDGHGGVGAAEYCKDNFFQVLKFHSEAQDLNSCLLEVIDELEADLISQDYESGTTALILLISSTKYFVVNIGDSNGITIYSPLIIENRIPNRNTGPLIRYHQLVSKSHTLKNLEERDRILSAGGKIVDSRLIVKLSPHEISSIAITRSLGDARHKSKSPLSANPDIYDYNLTGYEKYILLASDGLWDVFTSAQIYAYIYYLDSCKKSLHEIVVLLSEEAYRRGSSDNISIILIKFEND